MPTNPGTFFADVHGMTDNLPKVDDPGAVGPLQPAMRDMEANHIRAALLVTSGNVTKAAAALEVSHRTLCRKIAKLQIDVGKFRV